MPQIAQHLRRTRVEAHRTVQCLGSLLGFRPAQSGLRRDYTAPRQNRVANASPRGSAALHRPACHARVARWPADNVSVHSWRQAGRFAVTGQRLVQPPHALLGLPQHLMRLIVAGIQRQRAPAKSSAAGHRPNLRWISPASSMSRNQPAMTGKSARTTASASCKRFALSNSLALVFLVRIRTLGLAIFYIHSKIAGCIHILQNLSDSTCRPYPNEHAGWNTGIAASKSAHCALRTATPTNPSPASIMA